MDISCSYRKDTIAIILKLVDKIKEEKMLIDMSCGAGSYEFVAVEDIDYVVEEFLKEQTK